MRPVDATARRARGSVAERRAREGENDDGESADDAVAACLMTGDDDGVRATCDGASDGGRDAATSGGDAGDDGGGDDDGDGDGGETRGAATVATTVARRGAAAGRQRGNDGRRR